MKQMKQCLNYKCEKFYMHKRNNCLKFDSINDCGFLERFPQMAEEKPEIKLDPYVGKIVIYKNNLYIQAIIITRGANHYIVSGSSIPYKTIEDIKKDWYIQGEDF
jgi:hypothetical protein